ncbi:unnamed protein product [Caenorhabditis bovis]|uniref:EGF-like domain-containing protein n=1 Tax=Caenorhabditis bovis TaxID=2654633 RepID=A0A8S1F216_9PELO|nr:unnamed protein product [Caenorhabditis bovis]
MHTLQFLTFLAVTGFVASDVAKCLNHGTPLNATDCVCPEFVSGKLCEHTRCPRFGIADKNRCTCPPGWFAPRCGIRRCRPPVDENMDFHKRSLIIVFNTKTTMLEQKNALVSSFNKMLDEITTNQATRVKENFVNYIFYGFVKKGDSINVTEFLLEDSTEFLEKIKNIELQDGDDTQPVLVSAYNAQQTYGETRPNSVLLVFTDSPASDATPLSYHFEDGTQEQLTMQNIILWRHKLAFLLSLPDGVDRTSDAVDVYRRIAMTAHGDSFFVKNGNETSEILTEVIGMYYHPENINIAYGITGSRIIEPTRDTDNQFVFILITFDPTDPNNKQLPSIENGNLYSEGRNHRLYFSFNDPSIKIVADFQTQYNYRIFLQSDYVILSELSSDSEIDLGNFMVTQGVPKWVTSKVFGFPPFDTISYHMESSTNEVVREEYYGSLRPQKDCTFDYTFDVWQDTSTCIPGPLTNVVRLYYGNTYKQRVIASYCDIVSHTKHIPQHYVKPASVLLELSAAESHDDSLSTCDSKYIPAINDARMNEPNQYIFVLERHSGNAEIYKTLSREIEQIIDFIKPSTETAHTKEFTLIVHCDQESRVVLSSYNPKVFIKLFREKVDSLKLFDNLDHTMGLMSIIQAQKINILPLAQIFYFTNQQVTDLSDIGRNWDVVDKDTEFNFFSISNGTISNALYLPLQLQIVQRQSGGRLIPIKTEDSLIPLFADITTGATALTTDSEKFDCSVQEYSAELYVEKDADAVIIQLTGAGLKNIRIQDSSQQEINMTSFIRYKSENVVILRIDFEKNHQNHGIWQVVMGTNQGGCQVTARIKTSKGVILGFTSSPTDDAATTQIFSMRQNTQFNRAIYAVVRSRTDYSAVPTTIEIQTINQERFDLPATDSHLTMSPRDNSSCSFNYISNPVNVPKTQMTLWILRGINENKEFEIRRMYYYVQHLPADTSVCHGGQVNEFGQCKCPDRYTGEYCWDRICAEGATLAYGICFCAPGYMGDFCETELLVNSTSTTVSPGPSVGTTPSHIETTTKSTSKTNLLSAVTSMTVDGYDNGKVIARIRV